MKFGQYLMTDTPLAVSLSISSPPSCTSQGGTLWQASSPSLTRCRAPANPRPFRLNPSLSSRGGGGRVDQGPGSGRGVGGAVDKLARFTLSHPTCSQQGEARSPRCVALYGSQSPLPLHPGPLPHPLGLPAGRETNQEKTERKKANLKC
ncbi:hypothetical protein E2C01_045844 [Portunus trituberculatus]|uniref:Uncharacterized protein n=1 Tax=Portunus trituberculatus TaxID=210409 RepID=A0A5B7G340_PORTR|nr:hypothetical protein [Portunus trituberculatus]